MKGKNAILHNKYYNVLRLYLKISGIWPYHKLCDRCVRFVLVFTFCFGILIPQTLYLIGPINLDDIFECVPSIIIGIIFSTKILILMLNNKKIKICLNTIEKDWQSLNTDIEKVILQRHAKYGQYLTTFYAIFMFTTECLILLKPTISILTRDNILNVTESDTPIMPDLPYHLEYGKRFNQYVILITIHCFGAVFAHMFVTVAVDNLFYTLIQHACGMFSIIGYMLESIGKNADINFDSKLSKVKDENYNKALYCLRKHIQVIEFAQLIESVYTKIFLVNFNLNMLLGSLIGIQILMNLDKGISNVIGPAAIYIAQLTHLFLLFWQAQFLLDYSVLPYESICRANWYFASERCQKILLLIMKRTNSPCKTTAGKLVILSIESFGA
ncbi:hypothetical protein P5V15_001828 [Pogonomyrmex californicus]